MDVVDVCANCKQNRDCFLSQRMPAETSGCVGIVQRRQALPPGTYLFRRNTPLRSIYLVSAGSIKTQRDTADGELLVNGFYLGGDLVGIDAISDGLHPCDAIATTDSEVCRIDFTRLMSECARRPELGSWVMAQISHYAKRRDDDLAWTAGLHAHSRVLRFFLDLHDRLTAQNDDLGDTAQLPMRKQDIARYLQMTPETLSRNLAALCRDGLLELHSDRFALPDRSRARSVTQI